MRKIRLSLIEPYPFLKINSLYIENIWINNCYFSFENLLAFSNFEKYALWVGKILRSKPQKALKYWIPPIQLERRLKNAVYLCFYSNIEKFSQKLRISTLLGEYPYIIAISNQLISKTKCGGMKKKQSFQRSLKKLIQRTMN